MNVYDYANLATFFTDMMNKRIHYMQHPGIKELENLVYKNIISADYYNAEIENNLIAITSTEYHRISSFYKERMDVVEKILKTVILTNDCRNPVFTRNANVLSYSYSFFNEYGRYVTRVDSLSSFDDKIIELNCSKIQHPNLGFPCRKITINDSTGEILDISSINNLYIISHDSTCIRYTKVLNDESFTTVIINPNQKDIRKIIKLFEEGVIIRNSIWARLYIKILTDKLIDCEMLLSKQLNNTYTIIKK